MPALPHPFRTEPAASRVCHVLRDNQPHPPTSAQTPPPAIPDRHTPDRRHRRPSPRPPTPPHTGSRAAGPASNHPCRSSASASPRQRIPGTCHVIRDKFRPTLRPRAPAASHFPLARPRRPARPPRRRRSGPAAAGNIVTYYVTKSCFHLRCGSWRMGFTPAWMESRNSCSSFGTRPASLRENPSGAGRAICRAATAHCALAPRPRSGTSSSRPCGRCSGNAARRHCWLANSACLASDSTNFSSAAPPSPTPNAHFTSWPGSPNAGAGRRTERRRSCGHRRRNLSRNT